MKTIILIAALFLSGCVDTGPYRAAIAQQGAQAADAELDAVLWVFCKATPAGAVMRRFGTTSEMWNHYVAMCWREPMAAMDKPPLPVTP